MKKRWTLIAIFACLDLLGYKKNLSLLLWMRFDTDLYQQENIAFSGGETVREK